MKKILLLFTVLMSAMSAFADDYTYTPMYEKGKVWKYDTKIIYENMEVNTFYTITVVNGPDEKGRFTLCKSFNDEGLGEEFLIPDQYYTVQEYDGLVSKYISERYIFPQMDFNMKTGDRVRQSINGTFEDGCDYLTIKDDEIISVKGRAYRRLDVMQESVNGEEIGNDYWVEGIGSLNKNYLALEATPGSHHTPGGEVYWFWGENLNSVYKDGECIFEYDDFFTPGISATVIKTVRPAASNMEDDRKYNLNGTVVGNTPVTGLYIKDGKKILVK